MVTQIQTPPTSSPLSSIQGGIAYGDGNPDTVTTIQYNFDQYDGSQNWTAEYRADYEAALAVIASVTNIQFVEVDSWMDADIYAVIAPGNSVFFRDTPGILGYQFSPSDRSSEGAFNTEYWTAGAGGNGDAGGYYFTTLLHELGHALGLGHPHDTSLGTTVMRGVTSEFDSFGVGGLNQGAFTVMGYNAGWTSRNGLLPLDATWGGSTGLGALDIAALQAMYGVNTTYNSGENTYQIATANAAGVGYQSIWDTGGTDAIRYSGSGDARIDLRPATLDYTSVGGGGISYVDGVQGGYTIASGVDIENASGGSGNDVIIGNTVENVLDGNGGNDSIYSLSNGSGDNTVNGGGGNDTIYLADSSGADTVNGDGGNDIAIVTNNTGSFSGGTGNDTIRFVSGIQDYLLSVVDGVSQFFNVITSYTFTVSDDVELFEFSDGALQYDMSGLAVAMQVDDVDTTGTVLQHANQGIYFLGGNAVDNSANTVLFVGGTVVGEDYFTRWDAIQAEAEGDGYRVLWQHEDGRFMEWTVDGDGNYVSSATIANVVNVEVFYGVDINDDGEVGHAATTVEEDGDATLGTSTVNSSNGGYVIDGSVEVTLNGAPIGPNTFAGWSAIQAEADGDGYRMLWQNSDGQFFEWVLNGQGERQTGYAIENIVDVEEFYGVDISDDGTIGHVLTPVESDGATPLASSTSGAYVIAGSVEVTLNGGRIGPDTFAGWSAIQAEANGDGYRMLWQNDQGAYFEWILNAQGERIAGYAVENVIGVEEAYDFDFSDDGTLGYVITAIESDGDTTLASSNKGVYVIDGDVEVTLNGGLIGPDTFDGWSAVHAEADGSGYRMLWENNGQYFEWVLNGQGERLSGQAVENPIDVEDRYDVDLNDDSMVGYATTAVEDDGSTTLASSEKGVYLIDDDIEVTLNGGLIGPDTFDGWSAIQAEADGDGYRMLWQNDQGAYYEWVLDGQGERLDGYAVDDVVAVETFYGADIDGSGGIGAALDNLLMSSAAQQRVARDLEALDQDAEEFDFVSDAGDREDLSDTTEVELALYRDAGSDDATGLEDAAGIDGQSEGEASFATILDEDFFVL